MRTETLDCLQKWAKEKKILQDFQLFVFGSIVEDDAGTFMPKSSDIDLVLCFQNPSLTYVGRAGLLKKLRSSLLDLEVRLLQLYKRGVASKPITSAVVLTQLERKLSLHKGADPTLLSAARFVSIDSTKLRADTLVAVSPEGEDPGFEAINREAGAAIRAVQKFRNQYVQMAPNSEPTVAPFDDEIDPLDKALMREAAKVLWTKGSRESSQGREAVRKGLEFIAERINDLAKSEPALTSLTDGLSVRRKARGTPRPLTADEQLLAWEILFEEAVGALRPTGNDCLEGALAVAQNTLK